MLTTRDPVSERHLGSGVMRNMRSLSVLAQTIHGPVQKVDSFLGAPLVVWGVKSHTLAPMVKNFLSWL
jgi:hypothetical protein